MSLPEVILAEGGLCLSTESEEAKQRYHLRLIRRYLEVNLDFPGLRVLHVDPPVFSIPHFASPEVCSQLIESSKSSGALQHSGTGSIDEDYKVGSLRTSSSIGITRDVLLRHPEMKPGLLALLQRVREGGEEGAERCAGRGG